MTIKKQFKYVSVKTRIRLNIEKENDYKHEVTLRQRQRRERYQIFKDITTGFPVDFDSENLNMSTEDADMMNEFMNDNKIKGVRTLKSADGKRKFLVVYFYDIQARNYMFNRRSDDRK